MNKTPWLNSQGKFDCKTCSNLQKYFLYKTGKQVEIHKTKTYLVINYASDGQLQTEKIPLTAGVLYCLEEKDLQPLISKINANRPKTDGHGDGEYDE